MASSPAPASTAARTRVRRAAADPLALDAQLCFALYSALLAMTKRYRPLLDAIGLTYPQYLVMLALWEGDGLSVSALGERLRLHSGTLTPLLKRPETLGLLQRRRAADDERRVQLTLTPTGRQLRRRALAIPPQLAQALGCSAPERVALTEALRSLRDTLGIMTLLLSPLAGAGPAAALAILSRLWVTVTEVVALVPAWFWYVQHGRQSAAQGPESSQRRTEA